MQELVAQFEAHVTSRTFGRSSASRDDQRQERALDERIGGRPRPVEAATLDTARGREFLDRLLHPRDKRKSQGADYQRRHQQAAKEDYGPGPAPGSRAKSRDPAEGERLLGALGFSRIHKAAVKASASAGSARKSRQPGPAG